MRESVWKQHREREFEQVRCFIHHHVTSIPTLRNEMTCNWSLKPLQKGCKIKPLPHRSVAGELRKLAAISITQQPWINSFPAKHEIFRYSWDNASPPNTEYSGFPCFHCYTLALIKHRRGRRRNEWSHKHMHKKNINKQHINENCLMLPSEMLIQEVVKDCASFGCANGSHLLHLCFDHRTEYDADVVFDKNVIFSAFCSKCCFFVKLSYIQALIKKECLKLE